MCCATLFLLMAPLVSSRMLEKVDPIQKVVSLITELQGKVSRDGEAEEAVYKEFFEWCDDDSKEKGFQIKTASAKKEKLDATISEASSDVEEAGVKIEELSGTLATNEADLKAATEIRKKENADFAAEEKELMEGVDMLGRAIGILEKAMGGSSLVQTKVDMSDLNGILQSLSVVIDAASFSANDKQKLVSLLQSQQDDAADDSALGATATATATATAKSGGIIDVLTDMKEKAEGELSAARKAEMESKFNYTMLKQSLTDALDADNKEMEEAKANKAEGEEIVSVNEGELSVTTKELAEVQEALQVMSMDCMEKATNHEISKKGRAEELAALAKAKKIIQAMALAQTQSPSFLQLGATTAVQSKIRTRADLANNEVINLVRKLAKEHHSKSLMQLASRIGALIRYGSRDGEDPFAKVKGLINEMISKLLKEAEAEASEKGYCDQEMAKTAQKKGELSDDVEKLTAKIDKAASDSTRLKEEVKTLQGDLAELQASKSEMDKIRKETNEAFEVTAADLQKGLDGIRAALKVLRDYYGGGGDALLQTDAEGDDSKFDAFMQQPAAPEKHGKSSGAGGGIISLLEVAESDFAKNLAEEQAEEAAAQEEYDKVTAENEITKATKDQDVKYKTKEHKALDKALTEYNEDRDGTQTELDAVLEYDEKIKDRCVAKPMSYEEQKKRRDAEIKGLKEALSILEGQAVFLQKRH